MYANPAPPRGLAPFARAAAICALLSPSTPPVPGHVSLLINTDSPSSEVYSGSSFTSGRLLYVARLLRASVTCHPKCQIAVCGWEGGGTSTFVNSTRTSFGERSAGTPPHVVFDVLGNWRE